MTRLHQVLYECGINFPENASRTELRLAWAVRLLAEEIDDLTDQVVVLTRQIERQP